MLETACQRPGLPGRYTHERDGKLHMRLLEDARCMALAGRAGGRVSCRIYHLPAPCRRVQAGSELCLRYRREQGLEQARANPAH